MLINVTARYYLNKHLDASSLGVLGLHLSFKIHNNIVLAKSTSFNIFKVHKFVFGLSVLNIAYKGKMVILTQQ